MVKDRILYPKNKFSLLLSNIVLEVVASAIRQKRKKKEKKKRKVIQIRKEDIKLSLFSDNMIICIENTGDGI